MMNIRKGAQGVMAPLAPLTPRIHKVQRVMKAYRFFEDSRAVVIAGGVFSSRDDGGFVNETSGCWRQECGD